MASANRKDDIRVQADELMRRGRNIFVFLLSVRTKISVEVCFSPSSPGAGGG